MALNPPIFNSLAEFYYLCTTFYEGLNPLLQGSAVQSTQALLATDHKFSIGLRLEEFTGHDSTFS